APDRQKVDQLNEQAGLATARLTHQAYELTQARQKSIMPRAQQRTARHIAYARRLDDDRTRLPLGESLVPFQHLGRDETLFAGPPRDHRRYPGSLRQSEASHLDRREQPGCRRFGRARPTVTLRGVPDALRRSPHSVALRWLPAAPRSLR